MGLKLAKYTPRRLNQEKLKNQAYSNHTCKHKGPLIELNNSQCPTRNHVHIPRRSTSPHSKLHTN